MKTDNFKLVFKENFVTEITFGNARFLIKLLDILHYSDGEESFIYRYELNGIVKISIISDNLPVYYRCLVRGLFFGQFAYDKNPFYKSPALECIAIKRAIENYLKRTNSKFVTNIDELCV